MRAVVVLFTRDLRVRDNPALARAIRIADAVLPLFVVDRAILGRTGAPNRVAFLLEALADLNKSLGERGSALIVRSGDVAAAAIRVATEAGAEAIFLAEDVSAYARARERELRRAAATARIEVHTFPGVTVIAPGDVTPTGSGDHFRVFTAFWNQWRTAPLRSLLQAPERLPPPTVETGRLPELAELSSSPPVRSLPPGGESEGRRRLDRFLADELAAYPARRDDLAVPGTSELSAYLHFGCLSPLEVAKLAWSRPGGEAFVRQLCWRDFHHQTLAANPTASHSDLRNRGDRWRDDPGSLEAWKAGMTGYPLVDAGMRQLTAEGFMHNRARMVTASFLTKHLYLDWRLGADHFARNLVDGDVASNALNWQWVAGTGFDTRPNRFFNPTRQARRHDPNGDYVRRWVPELAELEGAAVHEPWRTGCLRHGAYPPPIVSHDDAVARFRAARRAEPGGR
jgi:deoxyribodipyrimidine photo-lyase